jgi:hypothetical protein
MLDVDSDLPHEMAIERKEGGRGSARKDKSSARVGGLETLAEREIYVAGRKISLMFTQEETFAHAARFGQTIASPCPPCRQKLQVPFTSRRDSPLVDGLSLSIRVVST